MNFGTFILQDRVMSQVRTISHIKYQSRTLPSRWESCVVTRKLSRCAVNAHKERIKRKIKNTFACRSLGIRVLKEKSEFSVVSRKVL